MPQNQLRGSSTSKGEQTTTNRHDHIVTTDIPILGTILGTSIEGSESTNQELKHLGNLSGRDEPFVVM
jgi:hypothetical protein